MASKAPPPSNPREDLLARAAEQTTQLAAQLQADSTSLGAAKLDSAANALARCAVAAEELSEVLREPDKRVS